MKVVKQLAILLSILLFPGVVNAQIKLNEIYPAKSADDNDEFIELYNTQDSEIFISGYYLEDAANHTFTIPDSTISAKSYIAYTKSQSGIPVNNDSETIYLKDKDGNEIDKFSYTSTISQKSWSRIPDGTGGFVNNTDPTKNYSNSPPPNPTNTPTPTPTDSPTPTDTPKPTSTPKPKATTPQVKSAQAAAANPASARQSGEVLDPDDPENLENSIENLEEDVQLGENEKQKKVDDSEGKFPTAALLLMLGGASFIGAAFIPYIKSHKGSYNKKDDSVQG